MTKTNINKVSSQLSGIFASFTILATGSNIFFRSKSFDFDSVMFMLKIAIPASIVAGFLGYAIGKIFEGASFSSNSANSSKKKDNLLIDDILFDEIKETDPISEIDRDNQ